VTFKKWPHFKIPRPPIGYDIAVIFCESFWSRLLPIEAEFRGFWVNLEREVITDRCEIRKFRPDLAYPVDHIVQSRQFAAHHYRLWSALHKSSIGEDRCPRCQSPDDPYQGLHELTNVRLTSRGMTASCAGVSRSWGLHRGFFLRFPGVLAGLGVALCLAIESTSMKRSFRNLSRYGRHPGRALRGGPEAVAGPARSKSP